MRRITYVFRQENTVPQKVEQSDSFSSIAQKLHWAAALADEIGRVDAISKAAEEAQEWPAPIEGKERGNWVISDLKGRANQLHARPVGRC
jgi:hypothetical protein